MTREEAINQLQDAKDGYKEYLTDEVLDMAIEALEQEPILDKIRSEIEEQKSCVALNDDDLFWYKDGLNDAIEIIDKYRQEG